MEYLAIIVSVFSVGTVFRLRFETREHIAHQLKANDKIINVLKNNSEMIELLNQASKVLERVVFK